MKTWTLRSPVAAGCFVVGFLALCTTPANAETRVEIRAVTGIGYSVDWVTITYRDASGQSQRIHSDRDIPLGQEANFTIPTGATNIVLEAKPRASLRRTRIFNNLSLESEREHCFELRGTVNHPRYTRVNCGWTPRGRVAVFDTRLNRPVGLKRVKVEVRSRNGLSEIGSTYTDDNAGLLTSA